MLVETPQVNIRTRVIPAGSEFSRPEEFIDPLRHNLRLVIGGEVVEEGGNPVRVQGLLGQAINLTQQEIADNRALIESRQEDLLTAKLATRGRIRLFNVTLRAADIERQANRERDQVLKEKKRKLEGVQAPLERQIERVDQYVKQQGIDAQVDRFNHLVAVEVFLEQGGQSDLDSVRTDIEALWSANELSVDDLRTLVAADKAFFDRYNQRKSYEGYKALIAGVDQGETRVKGLWEYANERAAAAAAFAPQVDEVMMRWRQARERAGRYDALKDEIGSSRANIDQLRIRLRGLTMTAAYLGDGYLPDPGVVIGLGEQLKQAQQDLEELSGAERLISTQERVLRTAGQKVSNRTDSARAKMVLTDKIKGLKERFAVEVDPIQKILTTKSKSPEVLERSAKRIASGSTPTEDVFDQLVLTLTGKTEWVTVVQAPEKPVQSTPPLAFVSKPASIARGEAPVVVPAVFEGKKLLGEESTDQEENNLQETARERIFNQILMGELSARQLLTLAADSDANDLNTQLVAQGAGLEHEAAIDVMIASLINSVKVAEGGERGIPRSWLPRLSVQAMLDAVTVLNEWTSQYNGSAVVDDSKAKVVQWKNINSQPLEVGQLKEYLEEIRRSDTDHFAQQAQEALKKLSIIETSKQLVLSSDEESYEFKIAS